MKVSIITVTLNSEKHIEECILSVIGQEYKNIEHIIVDGKSADGTLSIIKKYEPHIAQWISETDRGMYDAINKGIGLATGDIVGILNSDDILASPDVIRSIVNAFETEDTDTLYGDLEYVEENDTSRIYRIWKGKPYKRSRFKTGWMPAHPTFYIRRALVEKYGGYENHYYSAADYEFMARYLFKYRLSAFYLPKLLVKMRRGGQSNNNLKKRLRANRRDYLAMKKNDIPFPLFVSILKPLSKLHQYTGRGGNR
jgi:glycosyltransferase involved in cell wall biosynthesis